jgi:VWFA-related protein
MKAFLAVFALSCLFGPVVAQTSNEDVIKITTNLVQVDAVVTRNGKQVRDLKAADFEIFEDGKLQTITSFAYVSNVSNTAGATPGTISKDTNTPFDPNSPPPIPAEIARRTIALVVDDYGLSSQSMTNVRRQLRKFIDERLKPNDLIAIMLTSRAGRELPHFTNDKSRINEAWERVTWNPCSRVGVKSIQRVGDEGAVGCGPGVASFDRSLSSLRAILNALGQVPGRKSMIIFSDDTPLREEEKLAKGSSSVITAGPDDSTSDDSRNYRARLRSLSEMAIRSSVVIYGIEAAGLQVTSMTAADQTLSPMISGSRGNASFGQELRAKAKLLQARREGADKLAKATGGFLIRDQNEFFDKILEDQSGYYLIGYRPSTETFDRKFHKIRARVKISGLEIRTRSGFFGVSEEEAKRLKEKKK